MAMEASLQHLKPTDKKGSEILTNKYKRSNMDQQEQDSALFADILKLMQVMSDMRFIQKIARPIEKRIKQQYVQKFAGKMESLHTKIERVRMEIMQRSKNQKKNNSKNKSNVGSVTHKPLHWHKSIREIETKYTEIFLESSFKYYAKIMSLNGFMYPLKTLRIQEWANVCLTYSRQQSQACECDCI